MSFPSYPKYKDSGVEWLGKVPEHWEVMRLKQKCKVFPSNVDKKSYDGEVAIRLCNYVDVYKNEIITGDLQFMAATATDEQIAKFTLRAGDVIITKDSETADDIAIAAYVPSDLPGVVCGYHLAMVRPFPFTYGAFVKRLFDSVFAKSCFAVLANGLTRVGLGQYELENVELPFPPISEQSAIASFLDHETSKIDCLISEQEKLIELLKEKRQAVISHAVTKGLNDNVKMKDSGVEWLGKVPEHWEVTRSDSLIRTSRDSIDAAELSGREVYHYSIPVVQETGQGQVEDGSEIDSAKLVVSEPQVLVSKLNPRKGTICVAVPKDRLTVCSTEFVPVIPVGGDLSFLAYLVQTENYRCRLESMVESVTRSHQRVQPADVVRFHWAFPSLSEQSAIASFLDYETSKIDSLIKEAESVINLLQERRSALISAAVTGQIDVRNFVPPKAA